MNVPNILTVCRLALIPVYIFFFAEDQMVLAFTVVALAGATDVLDGYLARRNGQVTPFGVLLDPLADKLMMVTVIVSFVFSKLIPWYVAMLVFVRDVGMIVGGVFFHLRGKRSLPSNWLGKATTVLFYLAVLLLVVKFEYALEFLVFVIVFSFLTTAVYIAKFRAAYPRNPN